MRTRQTFFRCVELILFILGLSVSSWLLVTFSIVLSVWRGNWIFALSFALAADLLFGVPVGILHAFILPFTFVTLAAILLRAALLTRMRRGTPNVL